MRTRPVPSCPVCGASDGTMLYAGLRDRTFEASGSGNLKRCPGCGAVYLDPQPIPEDIGMAYETYPTHSASEGSRKLTFSDDAKAGYLASRWGYGQGGRLGRVLRLYPRTRAALDAGIMYLPSVPGGRLLDVGCGSGAFMDRMRSLGWRVEGVDFDPQAVEVARSRGLETRTGTLEEQNYPAASFDAVTLSHVIEHLHDSLDALAECHRILKPNGRLSLVTPNADSFGHKWFGLNWRGLEVPRHLQIFTPRALSLLAGKAGFGEYRVFTTARQAVYIYTRSALLRRQDTVAEKDPSPFRMKLAGLAAQHLEFAALAVGMNAGEEVVLTAKA